VTGAAVDGGELCGVAFLPHPANRSETVRTTLMVVVFIKSSVAERPKLSDGLGGAGGAHGALTNARDARTDGGEAVRCSAWLNPAALRRT